MGMDRVMRLFPFPLLAGDMFGLGVYYFMTIIPSFNFLNMELHL